MYEYIVYLHTAPASYYYPCRFNAFLHTFHTSLLPFLFISFICMPLADSPSRRVLLDYNSPYLYGNYHTSPSEDLVALWFGANGTG